LSPSTTVDEFDRGYWYATALTRFLTSGRYINFAGAQDLSRVEAPKAEVFLLSGYCPSAPSQRLATLWPVFVFARDSRVHEMTPPGIAIAHL